MEFCLSTIAGSASVPPASCASSSSVRFACLIGTRRQSLGHDHGHYAWNPSKRSLGKHTEEVEQQQQEVTKGAEDPNTMVLSFRNAEEKWRFSHSSVVTEKGSPEAFEDDDDETASTVSNTTRSSSEDDDEDFSAASRRSSFSSEDSRARRSSLLLGVSFAEDPVTEVRERPSTSRDDKYYLYYTESDYIDFKIAFVTGKERRRKVSFAREVVQEVHPLPSLSTPEAEATKKALFYSEPELQSFLDEFVRSLSHRRTQKP